MKRLITKILTATACAAMFLTAVPAANVNTVQAAAKAQGTIDLKAKKLTIPKGKMQKIKKNTLTMVQKRRYQVKAKFGSTTVTTKGTYKSNKTAVATVSATGLVTAKAPGTATISVTYNGTKQTFKVKVVASHSHAWKTTKKATCAAQGKKLCQTCGVTGSTAKKTTHTFKVTKKATCGAKGVQTCTVCGVKENIAKTAHSYVTKSCESLEGRGKPKSVVTRLCSGCDADMTLWATDEIKAHRGNFGNINCFCSAIYGVEGADEYPRYFMVKLTDTYCKNCGTWKNSTRTDLYECDDKGIEIEPGTNWKDRYTYANYCEEHHTFKISCGKKHKDTAAASNAAVASVATFSDGFAVDEADGASEFVLADTDEDIVITDESGDDEDIVISGNEILSDDEIEITDLETGSDIVFEKADTETKNDGIAILATDVDDGIMVTSLDDEDGIAIEATTNDAIVTANTAILEKPVYIEKTVVSGNDTILTNELVSDSKLATVNAKTNGNFVALLSHAVIDDNKEEPEEEDIVIVEEDDEDEVVTEEDEEGEIVPEDE